VRALGALALLLPAAIAQEQPLAFVGVTVIDTQAGRARPSMTVVVAQGRIASVSPSQELRPPRGARIIDGRGKFLIPGLWDMHAHLHATLEMDERDLSGRSFFAPRLVAHGVTGVRSMFDSWPAIRRLRAEIAAGIVVGPRIVASGPMLDGPQPYWPGAIACGTAAQARQAVERLARDGVDFVKIYSWLPRDAFFAIAAEARRAGLPVAGHVPNSVTAAEASAAGQKSIEHLFGVSADPALLAALIKNGTAVTPTLVVHRSAASGAELAAIPPSLRQFWLSPARDRSADAAAARRREMRIVADMHKAGVLILAGSDTPNPYVMPGASLHRELELLVDAGLTPMQALQAATIRAADFLGMADRLGSIAQGNLADLVLLERDPLARIGNTRSIETVVLNGRLIERPELDRCLEARP
jgi:imidazolonepropionase-like amidohydrolase